jgi:AmmeMemoRadiSam system protein A
MTGAFYMLPLGCKASSDDDSNKNQAGLNAVSADAEPSDLPPETKSFLLALARQSLEACVTNVKIQPPINPPYLTLKKHGCFVTLTEHDRLRGCIGYIEGIKPLYQAVIENARNAALSDPRFPEVTTAELPLIKIEISVLTPPEPIIYKTPQELLEKIVPGKDGIILQNGFKQSTYLPQVWEQLPDKIQFLENLSVKGGMNPDGWKTASVKRYRAIHFQEN